MGVTSDTTLGPQDFERIASVDNQGLFKSVITDTEGIAYQVYVEASNSDQKDDWSK